MVLLGYGRFRPRQAGARDRVAGIGMALVIQDHTEEAAIHGQSAVVRVIDKTERSELIHEFADSRPGGAHHLCQVFLIDPGMYRLGLTFLAKMSEQ